MESEWSDYKSLGFIMRTYGLCRKTALETARKANCVYVFGNAYKVKLSDFDAYIKSTLINTDDDAK